jgi:hypothetical protein
MITMLTALAALVVALAALVIAARVWAAALAAGAAGAATTPGRMKLGASGLVYAAGVSGTYTVPVGNFATGVSCHASAPGVSLTITPVGKPAGPAIPVPEGSAFGLTEPLIGTANQLAAGSTLAFAGTDAYVVILG